MNGFFWGFMLSDLVLILWRIFKRIWRIPVSLCLGEIIGDNLGKALHMTDYHTGIIGWMFAALIYLLLSSFKNRSVDYWNFTR